MKTRIYATVIATSLLVGLAPSGVLSASLKPGTTCKKAGQTRIVNGEKFRCAKTSSGTKWSKTSSSPIKESSVRPIPNPSPTQSPNPTLSPSPTVSPTPTATQNISENLSIISSSISSNRPNTRASDTVTDRVKLKTNIAISELSAFFTNRQGEIFFYGDSQRVSGSDLDGEWSINFRIPKNALPGNYVRRYIAKSADGQSVTVGDFPLEILLPRYFVQQSCSDAAKDCPSSEAQEVLLNVQQCKLVDQTTFPGGPTNGFPRPSDATTGTRSTKILIVPISFKDLPFNESTIESLNVEFVQVKEFYQRNSYGKLALNFVIPEKEKWLSVDENWEIWKAKFGGDLMTITREAVRLSSSINLTGYDSIFFGSGKSSKMYWGGGGGGKIPTPNGEVGNVYFTVGGERLHLDHSLGHTLFQLEDLYIHDYFFNRGTYSTRNPLAYDVMGGGGDYSAWNRWLNGWLEDSEITCANQTLSNAVFKIDHINKKSGKRLVVIPTGQGKAIFLEYRDGRDLEGSGLWIYRIDSTVGHGAGPMEGSEELLSSNKTEITKWGYSFKVIAGSEDAVFVSISKQ